MKISKSGAPSESTEVSGLAGFECLVFYSIPAKTSLDFEAIALLQTAKIRSYHIDTFEQIISENDSHLMLLEVPPSVNIIS